MSGTVAPACLCAGQRELRNRALGTGCESLPGIHSPPLPHPQNLEYPRHQLAKLEDYVSQPPFLRGLVNEKAKVVG